MKYNYFYAENRETGELEALWTKAQFEAFVHSRFEFAIEYIRSHDFVELDVNAYLRECGWKCEQWGLSELYDYDPFLDIDFN